MNSFNKVRRRFFKSISNVSPKHNFIDIQKERIILCKLEETLGKPKEEVKKLLSDDLLSLLTMVPFRK